MIGYIYKTTNLKTNKIYIGKHESTKFEPQRYIGSGKILKEQIQIFGKDSFICELIDSADSTSELNEKEKYWIKYYNSTNHDIGYNILEGGNGCCGYDFTEEVREKMSNACRINNLKRDSKVYKQVSEHHKGSKLMNNGEEQKWVFKDDVESYLANGWKFGCCKKRNRKYETGQSWYETHKNDERKDRVWVHIDKNKKWIKRDYLSQYILNGWKLGMKD